VRTGIFGSTTRDRILKFIALSKASYPAEIARALDLSLSNVQDAVASLHESGMLATRLVGRTRVVELNPTWYASKVDEFLRALQS
jgi:DNA-binding transcriptional ArsR family regulator